MRLLKGLVLTGLAAAMLGFVACGDDGSSANDNGSAVSEENLESSDSEAVSGDSVLSSSSKKGPASDSGRAESGSSSGEKPKSSSSSRAESSSSAKSSSSRIPPSSSSCEDGKVKEWYNLYYTCIDGSWELTVYSGLKLSLDYDTLVDPRDGKKYPTIEITGFDTSGNVITFTAMAQNLDYAEKVTPGAEEQSDDSKVEKYCYDDDEWNCQQFGGLYQWAEMMALPYECNTESCEERFDPDGFHQGICPDGWHLITYNEMHAPASSWNNSANGGYAGMKAVTLWSNAQGTNKSGLSIIGAGYRFSDGTFNDLFNIGRLFYPSGSDRDVASWGAALAKENGSSTIQTKTKKVFGYSVRCVKDY